MTASHVLERVTLSAKSFLPRERPVSANPVMVDDAMLQAFRGRRIVILSPHFDDACYSLGGFLTNIGHGDLINIFTQSTHFSRQYDGGPRPRDRQHVFVVRNAEDAVFARHCGLKRHDLGCEEPALRGRSTGELAGLDDDLGQIKWPLLGVLRKLSEGFAPGERAVLLAPLGVGPHVNHRATATLIARHLYALEPQYECFFYEDLPYSSRALQRRAALRRLRSTVRLGARHVLRIDWSQKKELIRLYRSQMRSDRSLFNFWPKALSPLAPHEAFWPAFPIKYPKMG